MCHLPLLKLCAVSCIRPRGASEAVSGCVLAQMKESGAVPGQEAEGKENSAAANGHAEPSAPLHIPDRPHCLTSLSA